MKEVTVAPVPRPAYALYEVDQARREAITIGIYLMQRPERHLAELDALIEATRCERRPKVSQWRVFHRLWLHAAPLSSAGQG